MKPAQRKAFNALVKIGAPVFTRDDRPDTFGLSAEGYLSNCPVPREKQNEERIWCDYYNSSFYGAKGFGVDPEVYDIVEAHGLFLEWENPGCLFAWPE